MKDFPRFTAALRAHANLEPQHLLLQQSSRVLSINSDARNDRNQYLKK